MVGPAYGGGFPEPSLVAMMVCQDPKI